MWFFFLFFSSPSYSYLTIKDIGHGILNAFIFSHEADGYFYENMQEETSTPIC